MLDRLASVRDRLAGTRFGFTEHETHVEATCPWGNRVRCHEPDSERFGPINLGMPYVEFDAPAGTARSIADFYRKILDVPAQVEHDATGVAAARAVMGCNQHFIYRETDRPLPDYDGHHVQIYIANFSKPYRLLRERDLISQEDGRYQYRFRSIIDLDSGRHLFTLEHEVRSLTHPMCLRPLINRNPLMTNRNYVPGYDQSAWAMPPESETQSGC